MNWDAIARARRRLSAERGAIVKDWGGRLPIALVYPNRYGIGMASLGFQTIYAQANADAGVVCERLFCEPEDDPATGPLSIEGQRPLGDFAVIAFSVSFELDYFNLVRALRQAGIPVQAADRDEKHPLVIAGGPAALGNPEPIAPFVDAFAIGEGEVILSKMLPLLREGITLPRDELLSLLAAIPGVYAPALYRYEAGGDRSAVSIMPNGAGAPPLPIHRQRVEDLALHATTSTVLTKECELPGMYLLEVARGCARGCRFCLAAYGFLPKRERPLEMLLAQAREGLRYCRRIGLVGAAVSDYSRIDELVSGLRAMGAGVAVSSFRVDSLTDTLLRAIVESGTQTLTLAPEAGSARLRAVINKGVSEEHLWRVVDAIGSYRVPKLKLYFMVGLPEETVDDVVEIVTLVTEIARRLTVLRRHPSITVKLNPFVPKPHTPFEGTAMVSAAELDERIALVKRGLRKAGIAVKAESPQWAAVEGILARGDRRLAGALERLAGASLRDWRESLAACGIDPEYYLSGEVAREFAPWKAVDTGVAERHLQNEYRRALLAKSTPPCPPELTCVRCGVCPAKSKDKASKRMSLHTEDRAASVARIAR